MLLCQDYIHERSFMLLCQDYIHERSFMLLCQDYIHERSFMLLCQEHELLLSNHKCSPKLAKTIVEKVDISVSKIVEKVDISVLNEM